MNTCRKGTQKPWLQNWKFFAVMIFIMIVIPFFFSWANNLAQAGGAPTSGQSGQPARTGASLSSIPIPGVTIVPWGNGVVIHKISEPVTQLVINKINQWSDAYETPPHIRYDVYMPSANFVWWFSTGEWVPNRQLASFLATLTPDLYPRTFRLLDRNASGNASIVLGRP